NRDWSSDVCSSDLSARPGSSRPTPASVASQPPEAGPGSAAIDSRLQLTAPASAALTSQGPGPAWLAEGSAVHQEIPARRSHSTRCSPMSYTRPCQELSRRWRDWPSIQLPTGLYCVQAEHDGNSSCPLKAPARRPCALPDHSSAPALPRLSAVPDGYEWYVPLTR